MDNFIFSLLIALLLTLSIGTPILLTFWMYKILRKRTGDSKWKIFSLLPIFILGYVVYGAFYPSEEFYKEDFREVTGIDLPENSEFKYKNASYPDINGDYTSVSIIKIGSEFYKSLQSDVIKNGLSQNELTISSKEMNNAKRHINGLEIDHQFSKENENTFYYVAFLSDKRTLLIQRLSH